MNMKEVLTKSFWQGVKKTFYEAMESPPAKEDAAVTPAAVQGNTPAASKENPPSPPERSEEHGGI
jgi:hypothetical protein